MNAGGHMPILKKWKAPTMTRAKTLALFLGALLACAPLARAGAAQATRSSATPQDSIQREIAQVQRRAQQGPLPAIPMPLNAQMVTFAFDKDYDYPILTRPWTMVHVEFARGETILGIYLSDNTGRWEKKVAKSGHDFFIMPKLKDLLNAGVINTTLRTYHFTITSSTDGPYYKRVAWSDDSDSIEVDLAAAGGPAPGSIVAGQASAGLGGNRRMTTSRQSSNPSPEFGTGDSVDLSRANFDYRIQGDAPFKPQMVFDDGKFTWIQIPPDVQEIPAVFALAADGTAELVNFTTRRNYFVVQRLFPDGALLKLGKQEVKIFNRRGKACGFFGCRASVKNFQTADH